MRVAVTGASGRLGRALVVALEEAPFTGPFGPIAWSRAIFDLDAPETAAALLDFNALYVFGWAKIKLTFSDGVIE